MPHTYAIETLAAIGKSEEAQAARAFCLRIIRDFYGIDYNSDWHADLDSLTGASDNNWYSPGNAGEFCILRHDAGRIVATGGFYDLAHKPATAARLADRYGAQKICQVARVYIEPSLRGQGLGGRIVSALETHARASGYDVAYLHADAQTHATLSFWSGRAYREFGRFSYPSPSGGMDMSVDFDKVF